MLKCDVEFHREDNTVTATISVSAEDLILEWRRDWGHTDHEPLLLQRLREILPPEKIIEVLRVWEDVCPACRDREKPCYCENDE